MAKIYAVANQKGGVGKTSCCLNLGAALAEEGKAVLLVDLDPQAGLSTILRSRSDGPTIYEVLMGEAPLREVIVETKVERVHLVPSKIDLVGVEVELREREEVWQVALKRRLEGMKRSYDYILIDCPPSLGVLTTNALVAAHQVIIPVQTEFLALVGLHQLNRVIKRIRESGNPRLRTKVLRTFFDRRTLHGREAVKVIEQALGGNVYRSIINKTIKFADAAYAGEPILSFAGSSEAAEAYRKLAKEVLNHGKA